MDRLHAARLAQCQASASSWSLPGCAHSLVRRPRDGGQGHQENSRSGCGCFKKNELLPLAVQTEVEVWLQGLGSPTAPGVGACLQRQGTFCAPHSSLWTPDAPRLLTGLQSSVEIDTVFGE